MSQDNQIENGKYRKTLSPIQMKAMEMFADGKTPDEICTALNRSRSSYERWIRTPAWVKAWAEREKAWSERVDRVFRDNAERVAKAAVESAVSGNTNAQRTCLQAVGKLETDQSGARSVPSLFDAMKSLVVNINMAAEPKLAEPVKLETIDVVPDSVEPLQLSARIRAVEYPPK